MITLINRRQIYKKDRQSKLLLLFNMFISKRKIKEGIVLAHQCTYTIFLCTYTTGESIKRLNIYCLVRTVWPLQRQERSWCG